MSAPLNILSFDIEEWFMSYDSSQIPVEHWKNLSPRIEQNIHDILQFLSQNQLKATFYIMGWVAENHPAIVKDIAKGQHEIGYHSYYHELPLNQGPESFENDLTKGLDLLENISGRKIIQYRAPRFSLSCASSWAIPILKQHGIQLSSSVMSGYQCNNKIIPDQPFIFQHDGISLPEMPLNRQETWGYKWVYTGSGYFRIMPYWLIQKLYANSNYNMAYFHPRDFDTQVPKTKLLPFYRNIMSNLGNTSTIPKLQKLIQHRNFQPVYKAWQQYQQSNTDIFTIEI